MSRSQAQDMANQIFRISVSPNWPARINDASLTFGVGPGAIYIRREHRSLFDEHIQKLHSFNKEIESSFAVGEFQSRFISHFRHNMQQNIEIDEDSFKVFFETLLSTPMDNYTVAREIFGITLPENEPVWELGPFKVFAKSGIQNVIPAARPATIDTIFRDEKPIFLISTQASARHHQKANEIADTQFDRFEKILKFMTGYNGGRYRMGILNHFGSKVESAYIFGSTGNASSSFRVNGSHEEVTLSDHYFNDQENGHGQIWRMLKSANRSDLENRILLAAEWLGQSYGEMSTASAFLKCAISLEIIFTYNEKSIITPSILNQISENSAILLGIDIDDRIRIEKRIKSLYGQRSAIVHSGQTQIDESDLYDFYYLSKKVLTKLITCFDLKNLATIEKLHSELRRCKYSCPAFVASAHDS